MLGSFLFSKKFFKSCQSGFYVDYLYKAVAENILRSIFIYISQFIAEKYIIEVFSKKIFESTIYYAAKLSLFKNLSYNRFFINIIFTLLIIYIVIFLIICVTC